MTSSSDLIDKFEVNNIDYELSDLTKKGFAADADTFVSQIQNAMEVSQ